MMRSEKMDRRLFIKTAVACGATMALPQYVAAASKAAEKPNVILIMADDVGWEAFGCYGGQDYKTPVLDGLAAEGVRFEHCYSTPICTPSRVKIMTGQYNFRNYTHFGYLNPKDKTFGNLMQDAGYKTAIAGKWQLNGLYNNKPGHDDKTRPNKAGFDEYCLWQLTQGKAAGERYWNPLLEQNGKVLSKEENKGKYGPDIMSNFLCDFMERSTRSASAGQAAKPFFVYYPTVLVHDPFVPSPDSIGEGSKNSGEKKAKGGKKANFQAMVNYMDKIVGRIVKKTEELGIAEDTLILFTADNGTKVNITSTWNNQQIRGGKGYTKDMGTHVPLIAYWKGHTPKGRVLPDLIDFTDFYPTLADVAGVKLGKGDPVDGRSFFPQLCGEKGNPRDWVLCHYQPYWQFQKPLGGRQFARTADYKLYRDGCFVAPRVDLEESKDLSKNIPEPATTDYRILKMLLDNCPPVNKDGGRGAKDRPVHPDWKNLLDD